MRAALWLFVLALLLRCLFWVATPDRALPYSHACQGDAPLWQQLAAADAAPGPPSDLQWRLPLRPPAMQYAIAWLWDGSPATAWRLRLLFGLLGALQAPVLYLALRREFAPRVALVAGAGAAVASNLLVLSNGLHVETPYLLVVLLTLLDWPALRHGAGALVALRWGALHGVAALLRAEHPLALLLFLLLLVVQRPQRRLAAPLWALLAFALVLLPWQLQAMAQVRHFNGDGAPALPAARTLPWDDAALARLRTLPAFQQLPVWQFVDDTVRCRGGRRVGADDLQVVVQAYGCWPEPLPTPLLALYGPLNFFLANAPESDGGFTNAPLRRPPPLQGGAQRYPPGLPSVLPLDGRFTPDYPPHLQALEHGYALGLQWLSAHPAAAARLWWHKLQFFWQGAASGVGGYALPLGLSGQRRPVDLVTADGVLATLWRLLLLGLAALGLWMGRRERALPGFLVPALTALAASLLFFGYARLGALALPSLLLLWALALEPALRRLPARWRPRLGIGLLSALLLLEGARALTAAAPTVDGRSTAAGEPFPLDWAAREVRY